MRKHRRGITLLELLIVVVIIGILAAIAYPNYRQYVQRSKRSEAMSALLQIATEQERFYINSNAYTTNLQNLGFPVADDYSTTSGSYIVEVTAADAVSYSARATYQNDDEEAGRCLTFTINASGDKTSAPQTDCWASAR